MKILFKIILLITYIVQIYSYPDDMILKRYKRSPLFFSSIFGGNSGNTNKETIIEEPEKHEIHQDIPIHQEIPIINSYPIWKLHNTEKINVHPSILSNLYKPQTYHTGILIPYNYYTHHNNEIKTIETTIPDTIHNKFKKLTDINNIITHTSNEPIIEKTNHEIITNNNNNNNLNVETITSDDKSISKTYVEELPNDLKIIARKLGYNEENLPNLNEITSLVGTATSDEAVDLIRDLIATPGGMNIIKSYLGDTPYINNINNIKQNKNSDYIINENDHSSSSLSKLPYIGGSLDRARTNIDILRTMLTSKNINPSFNNLISKLFNIFRTNQQTVNLNENSNNKKLTTLPILQNIRLVPIMPNYIQHPINNKVHIYEHPTQYLIPNDDEQLYNNYQKSQLIDNHQQLITNQNNYGIHNFPLAENKINFSNGITSYGNQLPDYIYSPIKPKDIIESYASELIPNYDIPNENNYNLNKTNNTIINNIHKNNNKLPQRISGLQPYATGKIHKADPKALDMPINNNNNKIISNTDEANMIESVVALTSGQSANQNDVQNFEKESN